MSNPKFDISTMTPLAFAAIMERLGVIEEKLEKKVSHWRVDEAVDAFSAFIQVAHRAPDNFKPVLESFKVAFRDKNIAELTPAEIEGFLFSRWGDRKPSTIEKRRVQLGTLFSFCIKELKRRGSPSFHNPIELVDQISVPSTERSGFIAPEKMGELANTFEGKNWLIVMIQLTAGLRIGEVLKLRRDDINGRVLTLRDPKSGKSQEHAVIPQQLADRLLEYAKGRDVIFPTSRQPVNAALKRHAKRVGLDITTHDLRRWCATFYDRAGSYAMRRFVLRHSSVKGMLTSLEGRYVAQLSTEEAMVEQDRLMTKVYFKEGR